MARKAGASSRAVPVSSASASSLSSSGTTHLTARWHPRPTDRSLLPPRLPGAADQIGCIGEIAAFERPSVLSQLSDQGVAVGPQRLLQDLAVVGLRRGAIVRRAEL